jgi:hypothetical protein
MIEAGNESQIEWSNGNWIFLDMGFSGASGTRGRTCGLLIGDAEPKCIEFAGASQEIVERIEASHSPVNLVIEAPLSVCFSPSGNPTGRSIEKMPGETDRLWYVGAGCAVMVASMYLVRKINDARPTATVRLYEGFVSYKARSIKSDHGLDTRLLREVVKNHRDFRQCIVPADELKAHPDDVLSSAFRVIGLDCGVPVVIRRKVPSDHAIGS